MIPHENGSTEKELPADPSVEDNIPSPRKRADFPLVFRHERTAANRLRETSRNLGSRKACWSRRSGQGSSFVLPSDREYVAREGTPRRLCLHYPDAIYHLIARGKGCQTFASKDIDRLLQRLGRTAVRRCWRIYAFAIISNRLHFEHCCREGICGSCGFLTNGSDGEPSSGMIGEQSMKEAHLAAIACQ